MAVILAIVVMGISVTPVATETQQQTLLIARMISKINEAEIYNNVYRLQNFTTRYYGYSGNIEASTWLYNKLSNISGLNVEYQGGEYRNVIATLPGLDPTSTTIYMVGAHYDSTSSDRSYAPGATDNGGGVAIVLEFARIMSQYRFRHTLKFAFWNTEEGGLGNPSSGSNIYVDYALANNLNISLYINFDSSCYDPDNHFVLDIMYNNQSQWVSDMMTQYNSLYKINFTLTYNVHTCGSDHWPFWSHGYTAVMTHEESHGPAHSPNDTIDKVSTMYAKKNGQLGMSVLANLAQARAPTDLNKDGIVNIIDIAIVSKAYGSKPGDPRWNETADLDKNGIINIVDLAMVAKDFGKRTLMYYEKQALAELAAQIDASAREENLSNRPKLVQSKDQFTL